MTGARPAYSAAFAPDVLPTIEAIPRLEDLTPDWAWGGSRGRGVKVAVIDSGIHADHPAVGGVNDYVAIAEGEASYPAAMKATIDIPDELYRKVKAKSTLEGRSIRAVAIELLQRWLQEDTFSTGHTPGQWPESWLELADEALKNAPSGPTAREILEQDRGRLERP